MFVAFPMKSTMNTSAINQATMENADNVMEVHINTLHCQQKEMEHKGGQR